MDEDEVEFQDMVIPRTIGEPTEDEEELELGEDDEDEDDPAVAALKQELGTLRETVGQQNQYMQQLTASLITRQDSGGGQEDEDFNLDDLPDPVNEREAFNKELATRVKNHVSAQSQRTNSAQNVNALETDLNNRFARDYEDLTGRNTLFKAAVADEIAAMSTGGLDATAAISADRDGFLKKVATRMRTDLGMDEDGGGKPAPKKRAKSKSRAKTLGQPSRGRTKSKRGDQKPKPKGFIAELRQQQSDMGLI